MARCSVLLLGLLLLLGCMLAAVIAQEGDENNNEADDFPGADEGFVPVKPAGAITFMLHGDTHVTLNQEEVKNYEEAGWEVVDVDGNRVEALVFVNFPRDMRGGVPGEYEVEYIAEGDDGQELARQRRTVTVTDIDECKLGIALCDANADCKNTVGSYECHCRKGFRGPGEFCEDVNECEEKIHDCRENSHCVNTVGSFNCVCNDGFRDPVEEGGDCVDIDECKEEKDDCHSHAICTNTAGSFECDCEPGWQGDGRECSPENPCHKDNECVEHSDCLMNIDGTYECVCHRGYEGEAREECLDIDECATGAYECGPNSSCSNTPGSYECLCIDGYHRVGDECVDIDECDPLHPLHDCDPRHGKCINLPGSYVCDCQDGYRMEDGTCRDDLLPVLVLLGKNPLYVQQFQQYSEPGFRLSDQSENPDAVQVAVRIPPELEGVTEDVGQYTVTYRYRYRGQDSAELHRSVVVEQTNQCELDEDHPHTHDCDRNNAKCIWHSVNATYTCECYPGYASIDGTGKKCKDNVPPVWVNWPGDTVKLVRCFVCQGEIGDVPDPTRRLQDIQAVDHSPNGRTLPAAVDFSVEAVNATYAIHTYSAADEEGNEISDQVHVFVESRDMRQDIKTMNDTILHIEQWLKNNTESFRSFSEAQQEQTGRLSAFTYWVLGMFVLVVAVKTTMLVFSKLCLLWSVQNSKNPLWADFEEAWSFYLRIRHPLWSSAQITEEVFRMMAAREQ